MTSGSTSGSPKNVTRLNAEIARVFRRSLAIRPVSAGDCGGCIAELSAAFGALHDLPRLGVNLAISPRHADCLWVSGPVTQAMREPLLRTWQAMPEPKFVIAGGACALDGHVFAGSPAVIGPVDQLLPVDIRIAGCPPSAQQIIDALLTALGKK